MSLITLRPSADMHGMASSSVALSAAAVETQPDGGSMSKTVNVSSPRILSIQAFRGLAAMLVAFLHLHNIEVKYYPTHFLEALQYGWIGVDLFFVISGVVISLVTTGKFGKPKDAGTFLYHRLARIYPTFWFYYAIVLVAFLWNPLLINAHGGHHADLIRSFFLVPNQWGNLVGQAWTLSYEMNFYVTIFLLLLFCPERFVPYFIGLWGASIVAIDCLVPVPYEWWVLWTATNPFIIEFLLGFLLFQLFRRISFPHFAGPLLVFLAVTWFAGLVTWTNITHQGNSAWLRVAYWSRPLCCGPFGFMLLLGGMLMEKQGQLRIGRHLCVLGDWSYSIYLSHEIVCEMVARTLNRITPRGSFAMVIVVALALPSVILVGYLSYSLVEHPVMKRLYKRSVAKLAAEPV